VILDNNHSLVFQDEARAEIQLRDLLTPRTNILVTILITSSKYITGPHTIRQGNHFDTVVASIQSHSNSTGLLLMILEQPTGLLLEHL
jgi:hypothetical protein